MEEYADEWLESAALELKEKEKKREENMNLEFKCRECKKRQKLEVGGVHIVYTDEPKQIQYKEEVRCRFCGSTNMEPPYVELTALILRKVVSSEDVDITLVRDTMGVDDKVMLYSETMPYLEKRIQEEPENGELRLRYANVLRRFNLYEKAIAQYEESLRLDSSLIGALINLTDIYYHRHVQYREKDALTKAREYFERAVQLHKSGSVNFVTLLDKKTVPH